jgi:sulfur-oxidizing protein SoxZ
MASIKIRAKTISGITTVKSLFSHPMETGNRKDKKTGEKIPAHHITVVTSEYNGGVVFTANLGPAISKNPYLSFKFKGGQPGEKIKITWVDNKGEGDSLEAAIK